MIAKSAQETVLWAVHGESFDRRSLENTESRIAIIVSGMIKSHPNDEYRREQGGSPLEFQRDSVQRCADLASKRFHTEQSFCSLYILLVRVRPDIAASQPPSLWLEIRELGLANLSALKLLL